MPCRYINGSTSATFGLLRHHGGRIELRNRHRSPVSSSTRLVVHPRRGHLDRPRRRGDRARLGRARCAPPAAGPARRRSPASAAMYASTSASNAAASIRRAPSRTISSSADAAPRGRRLIGHYSQHRRSFLAGVPTPASSFWFNEEGTSRPRTDGRSTSSGHTSFGRSGGLNRSSQGARRVALMVS